MMRGMYFRKLEPATVVFTLTSIKGNTQNTKSHTYTHTHTHTHTHIRDHTTWIHMSTHSNPCTQTYTTSLEMEIMVIVLYLENQFLPPRHSFSLPAGSWNQSGSPHWSLKVYHPFSLSRFSLSKWRILEYVRVQWPEMTENTTRVTSCPVPFAQALA